MKLPSLDSPRFRSSSERNNFAVLALVLLVIPIQQVGPWSALWTIPSILVASLLIAWGAESAQFFIAQGFALAILAWLQTLPEFAVEAVLAKKQQLPLLLANLTGALRLLTGLGWPMIYATAAFVHRKQGKGPMRRIRLEDDHCVEVVGLLPPLIYMTFVWWKASLNILDAAILTLIYAAYLFILSRMPPQHEAGIEALEKVPRSIVLAPRAIRIAAIAACFMAGGGLIYFTAEPFLGSLLALSVSLGIPSFIFVQWVAPLVSEFPEFASTFYWARSVDRASMALMNMVSSNINQWTLLVAMLPVVYSLSVGTPSSIPFDEQQKLELLITLGQSLVGMVFLINMQLAWWEAGALFALFAVQFAFSAVPGTNVNLYVSVAYFLWAGLEALRMLLGFRPAPAFRLFAQVMRKHG